MSGLFFSFSFLFFFLFCVCIDSPFFFYTQDSTDTYPNNYHGDHLRIGIPRTVQSNMRGRSRLGSLRSELGIGEIDAQGTCGGSGADMDRCAYCFSLWSVLGGSDLIFFFLLIIFPLPSFPLLCYSLTSSEIKHTKSLSEKSSTPDHVCQWTIDKRTPKLFFLHIVHVSHISSLLSFLSHPPHPSPPKRKDKKRKNSQKQTAQQAPTVPSHKPLPQQSHKPSPQKPTEIH